MTSPELIGTTIAGRYRVRRKLGEGGMGAVWLVQHTESLQSFALKTLHAPKHGFDRPMLDRFLREARAAAALRSRNVVKVIDAQMTYVHPPTSTPLPFIVMELLEGETLETRIRTHGALPPEQVVWMSKQVARALDLAHQKEIVHRDLKPENLFLALDEDGEPIIKVCDFGIAKLGGELGEGMIATSTSGAFLGTPLYMSPEQAKSASAVVPQSDQWALGLIVFKALTGRDYFVGAMSAAELVLRIVVEPMPPPSIYASSLPPAFDAWFARSCARDPKDRWGSVGEQVAALAKALAVARDAPLELDLAAVRIVATHDAHPSAPTEAKSTRDDRPLVGSGNAPVMAVAPATTNGANSVPSLRPTAARGVRVAWWLGAAAMALVAAFAVVHARTQHATATSASDGGPTISTAPSEAPRPPAPTAPTSTEGTTTIAPSAPTTTIATTTIATTNKPATKSTAPLASPKPKSTTTPPPAVPSNTTPTLKPKGATCLRSAECASGFCVAEECT